MANRLDPLVGAIINKLPANGATFDRAARVNWLKMMAMALGSAYGEVGAIAIDPAAPQQAFGAPSFRALSDPFAGNVLCATVTAAPPDTRPRYAFFIDKDGFAKAMNGDRINPNQLNGEVLYDLRGEGDLGAIIWADDTRGVVGLQIAISAGEVP